MRVKLAIVVCVTGILAYSSALWGQDLGPHFKKIKDGIYVQTAMDGNSNCGIIVTSEGVVLVDSGHNPPDSREILDAVKKLTNQPIRFLIDTETHGDHTTGHWVFSPPTVIINAAGAGKGMRDAFSATRTDDLRKQSPEMAKAAEGYKLVTPQIEYQEKMTLQLGGKTIEILRLNNVHSEADSAIWLPQDRVLFAASATGPRRLNNIRPVVNISDILAAVRMMKALNPEVVIPGHGAPSTTQMFDDIEKYYALLFERVGAKVREGKSLDQIKQEVKMPEYASWANQDRLPNNIEAAHRALRGRAN